MDQILTLECRAAARALHRLRFFLIVAAVAYCTLIATQLGYGSEQIRTASGVIALIFAALIVNTAVGMLDIVRYADIHRVEHVG